MKHLLDLENFTKRELESLANVALNFKKTNYINFPDYSSHTLANLFYENSTRTRISFELAAIHLKMNVINFDISFSSEAKGESIEDTLQTLIAMGIKIFVIRHKTNGLPKMLAHKYNKDACIINAGDGTNAHPSQALIDYMTIIEHKNNFTDLKIAIVGNIAHSRVANSFQVLSKIMGVKDLVLIAPKIWQPKKIIYGNVTDSLIDGITNADVVMCLRVQNERLNTDEQFDLDLYRNNYKLTSKNILAAKENAIIMHPGPINRGVEIDSDVADGAASCILKQVQNGVFMRMAILNRVLG